MMKKIFLLLLIFPLFVACSDNDDNNSNPIILTSIKINPIDKDLFIGDSYQLTIQTEPEGVDPKITWSSSDTKVATVSNKGLITAVNDGITSITATYGSLSNNITLISYKKQDYTSFVVYPYGFFFDECKAEYLKDGKFLEIAKLGNLQMETFSKEVLIEDNSINEIYIFGYPAPQITAVRTQEPIILKKNILNKIIISKNDNYVIIEDITDETQYPQ